MHAIEIALRGAAIGLLALVAVAVPRGVPRAPAAWIASAYALTVAAYCVVSAPGVMAAMRPMLAPIGLLAHSAPLAFWFLARALFEDGFRPRLVHAALVAGWIASALVYGMVLKPIGGLAEFAGDIAIHAAAGLLTVLSLAAAVRGAREDLVERRRRLRPIFVAMSGFYMLAILGVEVLARVASVPAWLSTLNAVGILAATFAFCMVVLGVGQADLFVPTPRVRDPLPTVGEDEAPARPTAIEPPDPALLARITAMMERDRAYREEGLTIAVFALRLGTAEHRVRRAINAGLGYRNFNAFLNSYRIADAKAALADPTQAEVPVLTIALDAGFASLGPFNRAFKAETGLTPSEFRARGATA